MNDKLCICLCNESETRPHPRRIEILFRYFILLLQPEKGYKSPLLPPPFLRDCRQQSNQHFTHLPNKL